MFFKAITNQSFLITCDSALEMFSLYKDYFNDLNSLTQNAQCCCFCIMYNLVKNIMCNNMWNSLLTTGKFIITYHSYNKLTVNSCFGFCMQTPKMGDCIHQLLFIYQTYGHFKLLLLAGFKYSFVIT